MPQVDQDSVVCGGDGRVACETLIGDSDAGVRPAQTAVDDPYFPVESIEVRIGDEIDWVDLNAVYDRDDSTKGNTNPKSQHQASHDQHHHIYDPHRISNSQRFSGNLKPKAPIIALPNKLQHSGYLGVSSRRHPNARIFPKKPGNRGKSAVFEPVSPKVSCFGKVLSDREREKRRISQEEGSGVGCWEGFVAIFFCQGGRTAGTIESVEEEKPIRPRRQRSMKAAAAAEEVKKAEAPGLGAMRRFASGRKASSWGGDLDLETIDANEDRDWTARRSVGSLEDAKRIRDWDDDGSSSV